MAYTRAQYQYYCCGLTSNTILICDLCLSNKFKMEKSTVATLATILLYAAKISTVTADCSFIKPDYSQPPCVGLIKCSDYVTNVTDQIEFWDCRRNVYPPSEKYSLLVEVDEVSEHQIQELFANYDRYKSHITSISFTNIPVKSISAFVYSLVQATNISITYNNIDSFALNKFRLLQNLGVLNVSNNAIEILESEKCSFVLPSLRVLDLSHNLIENVPAGYFNSAPQILHLNLSYNSIEKFDDQAFAGLHLLQSLSASNNKLTQIDSTKDIGNYMKFVPRLLVNTPALTELDLSSNLITDIGPSSFNNVKLLTTLDLSDNKLQSISFDTIDLGNLTHFRVKNNLIKNVTNDKLSNLVSLELLDLSYNPLEHVDGQALFNLNDLKYFNASSCGINDIEFNFFNGIQNVEIIDLSHNKIKTFLVDTTNLLVVRELYLSNNELEHITSDTFFGLTRLEILELDCNKIVSIQPGSFVTAYSVYILNLHDNKLRSLQFGTFDDMNKLESLDLSKNELDSINFLIFYKTRNLISLALDDNYLSSFEYYEIRDTTIKTLSLGGNTLSCKLIMQCLRYLKGVVITAKTKNYYTENIQGVACNNATLIETSLPDIANTGVVQFESTNTTKTKMVEESINANNKTASSDASMQSNFTSTSSNNFSDLKSILNKVVVCLVVIACLLLISLSLNLFKLYKSRWNRNENHVNRSGAGVPLMNSIEIKS